MTQQRKLSSDDIPLGKTSDTDGSLTLVPWPKPEPTPRWARDLFIFLIKSFHYLSLEAFLNWYFIILIYTFLFPISTKGNLIPFKQGYTYTKGREQVSALSFTKVGQIKWFRMVWFHWRFLEKLSAGFHKGACAHEAVMEITVSVQASAGAHVRRNVCQRETLLHLFLWGNGEAKPLPAHTVTGAKTDLKNKTKN